MLDEFLGGGGKSIRPRWRGGGVPVAKQRQKWDKQGKRITWIKNHVAKV